MSHPGEYRAPPFNWLTSWSWDPLAMVPLVCSGAMYAFGLSRLWRTPAGRRTVRGWQAAAFACGWLSLVVALASPLDVLSDVLFSAHMTQHELLMVIAAPLVVLGRPLVVFLWALPQQERGHLAGWGDRHLLHAWRWMTGPLVVWLLQAVALWVWHLRPLYEAALRNDLIHLVQHVSFFGTAVLFWWALVQGRYGRLGYGLSVLYVFTTALHSSALGALFTFAPNVWYPAYAPRAAAWGLSAIEDQQLAGLLMWIPFSLTFLIVGLALFAAWMGESDRRTRLTADRAPEAGRA
jgi:putative membrane protein